MHCSVDCVKVSAKPIFFTLLTYVLVFDGLAWFWELFMEDIANALQFIPGGAH